MAAQTFAGVMGLFMAPSISAAGSMTEGLSKSLPSELLKKGLLALARMVQALALVLLGCANGALFMPQSLALAFIGFGLLATAAPILIEIVINNRKQADQIAGSLSLAVKVASITSSIFLWATCISREITPAGLGLFVNTLLIAANLFPYVMVENKPLLKQDAPGETLSSQIPRQKSPENNALKQPEITA